MSVSVFGKPKIKEKTFGDLVVGDWFLYDNAVCIKIGNPSKTGAWNAFNIETNGFYYFNFKQDIIPINDIDIHLIGMN